MGLFKNLGSKVDNADRIRKLCRDTFNEIIYGDLDELNNVVKNRNYVCIVDKYFNNDVLYFVTNSKLAAFQRSSYKMDETRYALMLTAEPYDDFCRLDLYSTGSPIKQEYIYFEQDDNEIINNIQNFILKSVETNILHV